MISIQATDQEIDLEKHRISYKNVVVKPKFKDTGVKIYSYPKRIANTQENYENVAMLC